MARQERGVDVDAPAGRQVEDGARQDLPVGGDHDEVGREGAERALEGRVAQPLGLQHGEPVRLGQALHLGCGHPEPAAARAIGLADDAHHRIGARQQRFEDGAREGGRAHEHDAPAAGQMSSGRAPPLFRPWRSSLRRRAR